MLIESKLQCVYIHGSKFIYPGVNHFTAEEVAALQADSKFQEVASNGALIVHDGGAAPAKKTSKSVDVAQTIVEDVAACNVKQAIEIVQKTLHLGTLKLLLDKEQRKNVRKAIEEQIDVLLGKGEEVEEEGGDVAIG